MGTPLKSCFCYLWKSSPNCRRSFFVNNAQVVVNAPKKVSFKQQILDRPSSENKELHANEGTQQSRLAIRMSSKYETLEPMVLPVNFSPIP